MTQKEKLIAQKEELIVLLLEHPEITKEALAIFRELLEESKKTATQE